MPDILHEFPIKVPMAKVFAAVSTPDGLDEWWTKRSTGVPVLGAEYELWFGPEYDWRAKVVRCEPFERFELQMTIADADWLGTKVGFQFAERPSGTRVKFHHKGWKAANEHFRVSNHCWAMYLRVLRRFLEHGESVPYEDRLDA
jgi:uncharacterized protein YndB with AHSA1/START domain